MLVSAIHQRESATGMHMSPPSRTSLPSLHPPPPHHLLGCHRNQCSGAGDSLARPPGRCFSPWADGEVGRRTGEGASVAGTTLGAFVRSIVVPASASERFSSLSRSHSSTAAEPGLTLGQPALYFRAPSHFTLAIVSVGCQGTCVHPLPPAGRSPL